MAAGFSYESFAGLIGVCRDTLYHWETIHPIFSDSKKLGKARMLLYFEQMGLDAMKGRFQGFSAATYIFTMKNKCHWVDKQEVDATLQKILIDKQDEGL